MAEKKQVSTYENPLTIIDNESWEIWGNAIDNFGKVSDATFKKIKENQSAEEKRQQDQQAADIRNFLSDDEKAYQITSKLSKPNDTLMALVMNALDYKTKAQLAAERSKTNEDTKYWTAETLKAVNTLRDAKELIPIINTGKADFIQDAYSGDEEGRYGFRNVGREGGISEIGGNNSSFFEGMRVATNLSPGNVEFYNAEDGGINVRITGTEMQKEINTNAKEWFGYDMGDIEPIGENFIKVAQQIGLIGKDDQISDDYLTTNPDAMKVMLTPSNNKGYNVKTTIVPYDQAKILQSAEKIIAAQADAVLTDYKMANNVWRNLFTEFCEKGDENCKYHKDLIPDGSNGSLLNPEEKKDFVGTYMKYVKKHYIPNYKIAKVEEIQEDGSIKTTEQQGIIEGDKIKDLDGDGRISQDEFNKAQLAKRKSTFVKKGKEDGGKSGKVEKLKEEAKKVVEEIVTNASKGISKSKLGANRLINTIAKSPRKYGLTGTELEKILTNAKVISSKNKDAETNPWGVDDSITPIEGVKRVLELIPSIKKVLSPQEITNLVDELFEGLSDNPFGAKDSETGKLLQEKIGDIKKWMDSKG